MTAVHWTYPHPYRGRINAVIVDYGTPELAERCLESVRYCTMFQSVAVVDAKQLGWSYARSVNTILKSGTGDIVLALNADTRMLEPPKAVLNLFDNDPTIGVVGPRQVDANGMIVHGGIFGTNTQPAFRCWQQPLAQHDSETADTRDAITVSGSVYFARRDCWQQIGGFLETPQMYYEETWASYLARHREWRVVYTGDTTWEHLWNSTPVERKGEMAAASREVFRAACSLEGIACD